MTRQQKILAFAGSTRTDSYNKKLLHVAVLGAKEAGGDITTADLRDFPMPLYGGDLESQEGIPPVAKKFKELLKSQDGFLIASPEYNSSISGVLKNAIDWASRPETGEPSLVAFAGKTAALLSASPGNLGGLRGLFQIRWILSNIQVMVLPDQITLPNANEAFALDGQLKDSKRQEQVRQLGNKLVQFTAKVRA